MAALAEPTYSHKKWAVRTTFQLVASKMEPARSRVKSIQANDFPRHAVKLEDGPEDVAAKLAIHGRQQFVLTLHIKKKHEKLLHSNIKKHGQLLHSKPFCFLQHLGKEKRKKEQLLFGKHFECAHTVGIKLCL